MSKPPFPPDYAAQDCASRQAETGAPVAASYAAGAVAVALVAWALAGSFLLGWVTRGILG